MRERKSRNLLCRYEVLVPLLFNDGVAVPETLVAETFTELRTRFGAASGETQVLHGVSEHKGVVYKDDLMRFVVDVSDTDEHLQFFKDFKERLKKRFQQWDVWITSHPVEVI